MIHRSLYKQPYQNNLFCVERVTSVNIKVNIKKYNKSCMVKMILAFVISLIIGGFAPVWMPSLYTYLDVSESPKTVDVIVILDGGLGERTRYGGELYRQGYGRNIIISGNINNIATRLNILQSYDVPSSVLRFTGEAHSTYEEAHLVLEKLEDLGVNSALIITNKYHSRRTHATYEHIFAQSNIKFTVASPEEVFESTEWWNSRIAGNIAAEYPKMVYYFIAYGVWSG